MKSQFYLYRRKGGAYYCQDRESGKQESLGTKDRAEATLLINARNESHRQPILNLQMARTYLAATDPEVATRTWRVPLEELTKCKKGPPRERWERVLKDQAFNLIRDLPLLETRPEHLLKVMKLGSVSTNVFLRRVHNFALDMSWLPWPVLSKRHWPKLRFREKRAITRQEHEAILTKVTNPEWHTFYQLCWHLGGAQGDIASLNAESIDWENCVVGFSRRKTGSVAMIHFAEEVAGLLRSLPSKGPLFAKIAKMNAGHRATEFQRVCRRAGVNGVTLHSYRYAWAERAKVCGYPERFAQEALGHNSKAVHRAYARKAKVKLPALETYEKQMTAHVIPFPPSVPSSALAPATTVR